jgi:hypothetical protein
VVRTAVGIPQCGADESAYAYKQNENHEWHRFWQSEQDDYQDGKYFPQRLRQVLISPVDFRPNADRSEHLILTLGTEPWCSSKWHDVYQPKKSSYPVASARRPVLPMTLPPRKERKAALRISFHRSPCVNCSAMVLIRLRKPLTFVSISAICEAFACVLVISTVVWFP